MSETYIDYLAIHGPPRTVKLPKGASRYALYKHEEQGREWFIWWWHNWTCGDQRCGTFTSLESAMGHRAGQKQPKRKHCPEAVAEF